MGVFNGLLCRQQATAEVVEQVDFAGVGTVAGPFDGAELDESHLPVEALLLPREGDDAGKNIWTRVEHLG